MAPKVTNTQDRLKIDFEVLGSPDTVEKGYSYDLKAIDGVLQVSKISTNPQGDYDIASTSDGATQVQVQVGAEKSGDKLQIVIIYTVREMRGDKSCLSIISKKKYSVLDKYTYSDANVKSDWKIATGTQVFNNNAVIFRGKNHNWNNYSEKCSWLSGIQVKFDDEGDETNTGNIGVHGTVYVDYVVTKTETVADAAPTLTRPETTATTTRPATSTAVSTRSKGACDEIAADVMTKKVKKVLGHGYDITGRYAEVESMTEPVLDTAALNSYNRIEGRTVNTTTTNYISGTGAKEYQTKQEESLEIKASASFLGFSFSSQTKTTFSEERYSKNSYKFITVAAQRALETYTVQGYRLPSDLHGFLADSFAKDLDSKRADNIIQKYGTHVLLGMVWGARLNYSLSYEESITRHSTAKTFSTSVKAEAKMGGSSKKITPEATTDYSKVEDNIQQALSKGDIKSASEMQKQLADFKMNYKPAESKDKSNSGSSGGTGGSFEVTRTSSSSSLSSEEAKTTKIDCRGAGGNKSLFPMIAEDPGQYEKWFSSISADNAVWADFVPGTVIPIYEFVPSGKKLSRADVETACRNYIIAKGGVENFVLLEGKLNQDFLLKGADGFSSNINKDEEGGKQDGDISTQKGKTTGWEVAFELINLDGGKIAVACWFDVYEHGIGSGKSHIQVRKVIEIKSKFDSVAIGGSKTTYTFRGKYVGKQHRWIDATAEARGCPFLAPGKKFYVKIDGSGNDYHNIGIQGTFSVPFVCYKL